MYIDAYTYMYTSLEYAYIHIHMHIHIPIHIRIRIRIHKQLHSFVCLFVVGKWFRVNKELSVHSQLRLGVPRVNGFCRCWQLWPRACARSASHPRPPTEGF